MHRPLDPNTGKPRPLTKESVKSASSKGDQTPDVDTKAEARSRKTEAKVSEKSSSDNGKKEENDA